MAVLGGQTLDDGLGDGAVDSRRRHDEALFGGVQELADEAGAVARGFALYRFVEAAQRIGAHLFEFAGIETELEGAQASTDLIATGVLDYSLAPEVEEVGDEVTEDLMDESDMTKAAN